MSPVKAAVLPGEADLDAAAAPILAALRGAASSASSPFVKSVLEYLHDHLFDKDLDTGVAWERVRRLTQGQAESAFRAEMGVSAPTFLQDVRMLLAVSLLVHTRRSLQVIAEHAGFAEASSFIRRFHQWLGLSPEEFREAVQDGRAGGPSLILEILSPLLLHRVSTVAVPARTVEKLFDVLSARLAEFVGHAGSALEASFERKLAAQLRSEKLTAHPTALAIEISRAFFRGRALPERLTAEDGDFI